MTDDELERWTEQAADLWQTDGARAPIRFRARFPNLAATDAALALDLGLGRTKAPGRVPLAGRGWWAVEPLEQASPWPLAAYHAEMLLGSAFTGRVLEIGAACGADTLALAARLGPAADRLTALEPDPVRCRLLAHNLRLAGFDATADPRPVEQLSEADWSAAGAVWADPARRSGGRRTLDPADFQPPLGPLVARLRSVPRAAIKLAPALDPAALGLGDGWTAEWLSYRGECRELVCRRGLDRTDPVAATRLELDGGFGVLPSQADETVRSIPIPSLPDLPTDAALVARTLTGQARVLRVGALPEPGEAVFEPDPALIRAGLLMLVGEAHGLRLIDGQIAYLIGSADTTSPWLSRPYVVAETMPWHEKRVKARLRQLGVGRLTVKKRGFPLLPEVVLSKLDPRGDRAATLILTRRGDDHLAFLCDLLP